MVILLAISVSIEMVSSSARVTSAKSAKGLRVSETWTHRSDQGYLGPIKRQEDNKSKRRFHILMTWQFHTVAFQTCWTVLNGYYNAIVSTHVPRRPSFDKDYVWAAALLKQLQSKSNKQACKARRCDSYLQSETMNH